MRGNKKIALVEQGWFDTSHLKEVTLSLERGCINTINLINQDSDRDSRILLLDKVEFISGFIVATNKRYNHPYPNRLETKLLDKPIDGEYIYRVYQYRNRYWLSLHGKGGSVCYLLNPVDYQHQFINTVVKVYETTIPGFNCKSSLIMDIIDKLDRYAAKASNKEWYMLSNCRYSDKMTRRISEALEEETPNHI